MISDELIKLIENNSPLKVNKQKSEAISFGFNLIYLIYDSTFKYILRLSEFDKPIKKVEEDYLFELELLLFLKERRLEVSTPYKWSNQSYLLKINYNNIWYYSSLFSFIEGTPLEFLDYKNYNHFGEFVAKLHLSMLEFKSKHKRYLLDIDKSLTNPVRQFKDCLSYELGSEYEQVRILSNWLINELNNRVGSAQIGLVHGDIHNNNVHFQEDGTFGLFDFDFVGENFLVFDIACMLGTEKVLFGLYSGIKVTKELTFSQKMFIAGYDKIKNITKQEIILLPLLEMQRWIVLIGAWAKAIYLYGNSPSGEKTVKEVLIERIKDTIPHLQTLQSKFLRKDLYYYNFLLTNKGISFA